MKKDYLSIHENIYDRVVDGAAFSKVDRYGGNDGVNM